MCIGFSEQRGNRAFEPGVNLANRRIDAGWGIKNSRVGDNRQELMNTGPRDAPRHMTLGQSPNAGVGRCVPFGIRAVGVDENVRVGCNQLPRPS